MSKSNRFDREEKKIRLRQDKTQKERKYIRAKLWSEIHVNNESSIDEELEEINSNWNKDV